LTGNLVELAWHCLLLQVIQCIRWHKLRLCQPLQQPVTAVEAVNRSIDRCRDGVEEIEPSESAMKLRAVCVARLVLIKGSNRTTYRTVVDKLRYQT
jgi:phytoene/squalene synthetase